MPVILALGGRGRKITSWWPAWETFKKEREREKKVKEQFRKDEICTTLVCLLFLTKNHYLKVDVKIVFPLSLLLGKHFGTVLQFVIRKYG